MTAANSRHDSDVAWAERERWLDAFERDWATDTPPDIDRYLQAQPPGEALLLLELVKVDIEQRGKRGWRPQVEEYLGRYPELAAETPHVLDLIAWEYDCRGKAEAGLSTHDYLERFPHLRAELGQRLGSARPTLPGYEILEELGQGGMGIVYKARQQSPVRLVAVKMLRWGAQASSAARARFRLEAATLGRLRHPNIVPVFEAGECRDQLYFVLEYVAGGTLAEALRGVPQVPGVAAGVVEQLARAMQHAHDNGIVHRDLKPSNVLLDGGTPSNETTLDRLVPRIVDFGLARDLDNEQEQTSTNTILGTPLYMSPEQAAGDRHKIGPASDVYSLGVILYEMLTGRVPLRGANRDETLALVCRGQFTSPRVLQARVPRDLDTICLKCLHKEPESRYRSAAELADDLHRFRDGKPIVARPVKRAGSWSRRHTVVAALGVVLLAGVVLTMRPGGRVDRPQQEEPPAAEMRLLPQLWQRGETAALAKMLDELRPAQEQHGFTWRYFERLRRQAEEGQLERKAMSPVSCLAFAPDGQFLAVGDRAGTIQLWNTSTWTVQRTLHSDAGPVELFEFSPVRPWLHSGHGTSVIAWNPHTGQVVYRIAPQDKGVRFLSPIPETERAIGAVGKGASHLVTWNNTGTEVGRSAGRLMVERLMRLPSRRHLAVINDERQLSLLHEETLHRHLGALMVEKGTTSLAFDHFGGFFAVGADDGSVAVHKAHGNYDSLLPHAGYTGLENRSQLLRSAVRCLAFAKDGETLAAGCDDGAICLRNYRANITRGFLRGHTSPVQALAFAPDGRTLASAGADGSLRRWDVERATDYERLRPSVPIAEHFAVAPDGTLAVACRDRTVKLVDGVTGAVRWSTPVQPSEIRGLALDGAGKTLAIACLDRSVQLWSLAAGTLLRQWESERPARVVALSKDGKQLAVGQIHGLIECWDTVSGQARPRLERVDAPVNDVVYSPDGSTLLSAHEERNLRVWDTSTGVKKQELELPQWLKRVAVSHDGQRVAVAVAKEGEVYFWDARTWMPLPSLQPGRSSFALAPVQSLAFAPNSPQLLTGDEGIVAIWEMPSRQLSYQWRQAQLKTRQVAWTLDGKNVAQLSTAGLLRRWDVKSGEAQRLPGQNLGPVHALAFTLDGRGLFTGSRNRGVIRRLQVGRGALDADVWEPDNLRLWEVATGREDRSWTPTPFLGVRSLAVLAGAAPVVLTGSESGTIWSWERTGQRRPLRFVSPAHEESWKWFESKRRFAPARHSEPNPVVALATTKDGRLFASLTDDGTAQLWEADKAKPRWTWTGHRDAASLVLLKGDTLLAVNDGAAVRLWDVVSGKEVERLEGHADRIESMAVSADGNWLATGACDWRILLWDTKTFESRKLVGHRGPVRALSFAADNVTLASGSSDHTVRLWHVATGQELVVLEGHTGWVNAVGFAPDGRTLVSAGEGADGGGEVLLWRGP